MKRITLFPTDSIADPSAINSIQGQVGLDTIGHWDDLCRDIKQNGSFCAPLTRFDKNVATLGDGGTRAEEFRIVDQFEGDNGYLLIVDSLTLQSSKPKFGGYWVREASDLCFVFLPNSGELPDWINATASNWRWQRGHPFGASAQDVERLTDIQIDGVADVELVGDAVLAFQWATRGKMILHLLPDAKWGFTHQNYAAWPLSMLTPFRRSKLRLRRKLEWGIPTSRTFWTLWRRFYEVFIKFGYHY